MSQKDKKRIETLRTKIAKNTFWDSKQSLKLGDWVITHCRIPYNDGTLAIMPYKIMGFLAHNSHSPFFDEFNKSSKIWAQSVLLYDKNGVSLGWEHIEFIDKQVNSPWDKENKK